MVDFTTDVFQEAETDQEMTGDRSSWMKNEKSFLKSILRKNSLLTKVILQKLC